MRWARLLGDYSLEEAGKAASVPASKISEWETRSATPTVRQARKLAEFYRRPFLEFFSETIPQVPKIELVPDFRPNRHGLTPLGEKTLKDIQEWAETQRLNAIDLFEMNGEEIPVFPKYLYATENSDPEIIASKAREAIDFTINKQLALKGNDKLNLAKILRHKFEEIGILIFKDGGLKESNARGLCSFH